MQGSDDGHEVRRATKRPRRYCDWVAERYVGQVTFRTLSEPRLDLLLLFSRAGS